MAEDNSKRDALLVLAGVTVVGALAWLAFRKTATKEKVVEKIPVSEWVVGDVAQFDDFTARALGTAKPVVIYLYADWKKGTQESWCPDCVRGKSVCGTAKAQRGSLTQRSGPCGPQSSKRCRRCTD